MGGKRLVLGELTGMVAIRPSQKSIFIILPSSQKKLEVTHSPKLLYAQGVLRPGRESNPRIRVLQTLALPLSNQAGLRARASERRNRASILLF